MLHVDTARLAAAAGRMRQAAADVRAEVERLRPGLTWPITYTAAPLPEAGWAAWPAMWRTASQWLGEIGTLTRATDEAAGAVAAAAIAYARVDLRSADRFPQW